MADSYELHRQEGLRLHDLGRYKEAIIEYEKARSHRNDPALLAVISASYLRPGNLRGCREAITEAEASVCTAQAEPSLLAGLQILKVFTAALEHMEFRPNLAIAAHLYNTHLAPLAPKQFSKRQASLLSIYLHFRALGGIVGVETITLPIPTLDFQLKLYEHMMENEHYPEALLILSTYGLLTAPHESKALLEEYIANVTVSQLNKANAHQELADILVGEDAFRSAKSHYLMARKLFEAEKHANAGMLVDLKLFNLDMKESGALSSDLIDKIWDIKISLEDQGHFEGAQQAVMTLYQVALGKRDNILRLRLDPELQRLADKRGVPLDWINQQYLMLLHWDFVTPSASELIQALEKIWTRLQDTDINYLKVIVAKNLSEKHKTGGNLERADFFRKIIDEMDEGVPFHSRFLVGKDAFFEVSNQPPSADIESEQEVINLRQDLLRLAQQLNGAGRPPPNASHGIMKACMLAHRYMNFVKERGFCRTKRLVDTCIERSGSLLQPLSALEKKYGLANIQDIRARLLFLAAHVRDMSDGTCETIVIDPSTYSTVVKAYEKTEEMYQAIGSVSNVGTAQRQLSTCYQDLWIATGKSATSPHFVRSAQKMEAAWTALMAVGNLAMKRAVAAQSLRLWQAGQASDVHYGPLRTGWRFLGFGILQSICQYVTRKLNWQPKIPTAFRRILQRSAFEEAERSLLVLEDLIDQERHNLSALGTKEALLAKQRFRQDNDVTSAYSLGPTVYASANRIELVFQWVEKSKARSISDLLGLGIKLPAHLRSRINKKDELGQLLQKEQEIVKRSIEDPAHVQFFIKKELYFHRMVMRRHPELQEYFDLVEGRSVNWSALSRLKELYPHRERPTWFISWTFAGEMIFMLAVSDQRESYYFEQLDMTVAGIEEWYSDNMGTPDHQKTGYEQDGDTTNDQKFGYEQDVSELMALKPLIAPLLDLTREGDLLVFCLTGVLHYIPLHAAVIKGDPDVDHPMACRTLIERNPIVHTPSLTIFEQCTTRSFKPLEGTPMPERPGIVVGVYEDEDSETGRVYATCEDIAQDLGWGDPICGEEVTKESIALLNADVVHFAGHFKWDSNILNTGLELSPLPANGSESIKREQIFSVDDLFHTSIPASHWTIAGCHSAQQHLLDGDEPLGFISGLLCTGAKSVLGTLWRIRSDTGRQFAELFYKSFQTSKPDSVDLAVALQEAIIKMKEDNHQIAPYYWAGFVLYGTWHYRPRLYK